MDNKLPSEHVANFIFYITTALENYNIYYNKVGEQDRLTQDYLHALEINDNNKAERERITQQLIDNRRDRRFYKDRVEEIEPIVEFYNNPNNKMAFERLNQLLEALKNVEEYHKNRTYKPRVLREENE